MKASKALTLCKGLDVPAAGDVCQQILANLPRRSPRFVKSTFTLTTRREDVASPSNRVVVRRQWARTPHAHIRAMMGLARLESERAPGGPVMTVNRALEAKPF